MAVDSTAAPAFGGPAKTVLALDVAHLDVLDGGPASVSGTLDGPGHKGLARRVVLLQARYGHAWRTLSRARTNATGRFRLRYLTRALGSERVRLHFAGDPLDAAASRRLKRLNVFHLAGASWYGGGGHLACGGELTSSTLGVANKTLPCGTIVTLRYGGRIVHVPVVDRGPYVAGREYDLTEATKAALGFGDTGQVWATD